MLDTTDVRPLSNIFIDMDSLFDTKFSLLMEISKDLAYNVLKDKSYFVRKKDNFKFNTFLLGYDIFHKFYKYRNKLILKNALPTKMPFVIMKEIERHFKDLRDGTCLDPFNIYINTFPYKLLDSEEEVIRSMFMIADFKDIKVEFVYKDLKEINPKFIRNKNIELMILSNGLEWLEKVDKREVLKSPINKTTLILPKLLNNSKYYSTAIEEKHFEAITTQARLIMPVEFLDVFFFCVSVTTEQEEKEEKEKEDKVIE